MTTLINTKNITIGADPEFFIVTENGEAFPSTNVLKGNKDNPDDRGGGYASLCDNVLAEGNIPPANSEAEYVEHMTTLKSMINEVLEVADAGETMPQKSTFFYPKLISGLVMYKF